MTKTGCDVHVGLQRLRVGVAPFLSEWVQRLAERGLRDELERCPCHVLSQVDLWLSSEYERLDRCRKLEIRGRWVSVPVSVRLESMTDTVGDLIERRSDEAQILRREDRVQQLALFAMRLSCR